MSVILAVDAGTTGVTALVVSDQGAVLSRGYQEFPQHFPQPGWVEHVPEEIWKATLSAVAAAVSGFDGRLCGVGITNQRETVVLWDRETLTSPRPAIVWQDRRSTPVCTRLIKSGHEDRVRELTGLRLDPYFSATKLAWLAEHEPHTWALVESGRYAVGTVDSYLVARMTRGMSHITDVSNASRTLLFDLGSGGWSVELCELFGVPAEALPQVVPNWGELAITDPATFLGLSIPVAGIAGDQQSALFGQACFEPGDAKCTYGTGSFILANTGTTAQPSESGLLTTAAWRDPAGVTTFALEGSIFVTGAAVQWLRDGLGIIADASQTSRIAASVPDSGDVFFVPALTGLGAPHWDPDARGLIIGITRGTTSAHLVRATLEAIVFEVRDVMATMGQLSSLKVDGGAAANNLLCQWQADQLGVEVSRPTNVETTALGAAFMAGLGSGIWPDLDAVRDIWALDRTFRPAGDRGEADRVYDRWLQAVERSKGWA